MASAGLTMIRRARSFPRTGNPRSLPLGSLLSEPFVRYRISRSQGIGLGRQGAEVRTQEPASGTRIILTKLQGNAPEICGPGESRKIGARGGPFVSR